MHPRRARRSCASVDGYGPVADIILAHHERIDGKGYPRGLAATRSRCSSRMISVADTYDVMTARDSYREPVSPSRRSRSCAASRARSSTASSSRSSSGAERKDVALPATANADFDAELDFEARVAGFASRRAA